MLYYNFLLILLFYSTALVSIEIIPFERATVLTLIKNYLGCNPVIIEAGAFEGADTQLISKTWPQGIIHCFEPISEIFIKLKAHTAHLPNVIAYNTALSDKNGFAKCYVSKYDQESKTYWDSNSLLSPKCHFDYDPKISFPQTIDVPTITLESWAHKHNIGQIDLLWLQAQGSELFILKNASHLLKKVKVIFTKVIFVEAYKGQPLYEDVKNWLNEQGFNLIAVDFDEKQAVKKSININEQWYGNAIFVNSN